MDAHPTADELRRFAQHEGSAADVRAIARHLESCATCRRTLPSLDVMGAVLEVGEDHLAFEQLAAIVDGQSGEGEDHAQRCSVCARELADLRLFRESRTAPRRRWIWPVAASVLIALVGGGLALTNLEARRQEMRLVEVPLPVDVLAMQSRRLTFRGEAGRPEFDVIEPRNTVVMSERPTFRWNAPEGTVAVVEVFAPDFTRVATSPPLTSRSWTSPIAFQPGVPYRWQVSVGTMTIPAPPLPEALFIVVQKEQARAVRELERSARRPSLALASAYAKAGDFDRARAELHSLIAEGRQMEAAEKLLHRIDAVMH